MHSYQISWKIAWACCVTLSAMPLNSRAVSSAGQLNSIDQHHINEAAAACLTVRRDILENGHQRQPGETLPHYCIRIARPLPTESRNAYRLRLSGYEKSLAKLGGPELRLTKPPNLLNTLPANIAIWDRICRQLNYLPDRLQKVHRSIDTAIKKHDEISVHELGIQLLATIRFDIAVYDLLRDALP